MAGTLDQERGLSLGGLVIESVADRHRPQSERLAVAEAAAGGDDPDRAAPVGERGEDGCDLFDRPEFDLALDLAPSDGG